MAGLFSTSKTPHIPPPPPVTPLPDPEDQLTRARKRRAAATTLQAGQSTILSDATERQKLG